MNNLAEKIVVLEKPKSSPWPVAILLFLGTIICINMFFLYLGVSGNKGLIETSPYESGVHYQEIIDAKDRLTKSGIQTEVEFGKLDQQGQRLVALKLISAEGQALSGAEVELTAKRPADLSLDTAGKLLEKNAGVYQGDFPLSAPGLWLTNYKIIYQGQQFFLEKKEFLK